MRSRVTVNNISVRANVRNEGIVASGVIKLGQHDQIWLATIVEQQWIDESRHANDIG